MDTMPELQIEMVHLQLTARCNLNCWFCGQRKKDWMKMEKEQLLPHDWMRIAEWLEDYAKKTGRKPVVMIWGGEAILSPVFEPIVSRLHESGFSLGMITNGTLLDKHQELIEKAFAKLYISIDGGEKEHDEIRGNGVYKKVQENLKNLKADGPDRILMMVLTEKTVPRLKDILNELTVFEPDRVILQDMISIEKEGIESYKKFMRDTFLIEAAEMDAWLGTKQDDEIRRKVSRICQEQIKDLKLPYDLEYLPHIEDYKRHCLSPFRHIHIMWNGEVSFCTDFTDFSCGSVKEELPDVLFLNKKAKKFREAVMEGKCVTCEHCSWRYKENFGEL